MSVPRDPSAGTAAGARPLRRDAERNRRRILEAAGAAFAERGLGVTMDEIAQRAGVGVGTVYRHFPEKEVLVDALLEDTLVGFVTSGKEALEREDPWEALVGFIEYGMRTQAENRAFEDLVLGSRQGREHLRVLAPIIDELVDRAQRSGSLRPDISGTDLPLLQVMIGSLVDFTRDVEPEAWRRAFTIIVDGLRARDDRTVLAVPPLDLAQVEAATASRKPTRRS